MKKLLALLLLSPFASADMDKICSIGLNKFGTNAADAILEKGCERNNVLQIVSYKVDEYTRESLLFLSDEFCRFDRNRTIERGTLSCILYAKKPRRYTTQKD